MCFKWDSKVSIIIINDKYVSSFFITINDNTQWCYNDKTHIY